MAAPALARTRGRTARLTVQQWRAAICAWAALALALSAPLQAANDGDKQLARVTGTVQYQAGSDAAYHAVFGRIDLADDAVAVTLAQSRAQLTLPDSSAIDIGATTRVRLGAFNTADTANPNVVVLELGTLHFTIRHPAGGRANYVFKTPTSQIGVRGTEGYLVTGPSGTDFYCADCAPGDVTVTVGSHSYTLATGDQAIVIGTTPANADVDVIARPCANPAAIELSDGKLGAKVPPDQRFDTTGAPAGNPLLPVAIPDAAR
ncbi:MAG: FecR family protein [Candidatus Lustribacter sp.]